MGSCAFSTIVPLVIEYTEDDILSRLNSNNLLICKRHVDKCICITPNENINYAFNNVHQKLKCAIELAKNNKFRFLDHKLI